MGTAVAIGDTDRQTGRRSLACNLQSHEEEVPKHSKPLHLEAACTMNSCLTLNLLTTTIVAPPSNVSKWKMGFNSAFKGLI